MSDSSTVYACCRACKGVVGVIVAADGEIPAAQGRVTDAGFRPYVTGPGAETHYPPGYKLSASCRLPHEFEVPA